MSSSANYRLGTEPIKSRGQHAPSLGNNDSPHSHYLQPPNVPSSSSSSTSFSSGPGPKRRYSDPSSTRRPKTSTKILGIPIPIPALLDRLFEFASTAPGSASVRFRRPSAIVEEGHHSDDVDDKLGKRRRRGGVGLPGILGLDLRSKRTRRLLVGSCISLALYWLFVRDTSTTGSAGKHHAPSGSSRTPKSHRHSGRSRSKATSTKTSTEALDHPIVNGLLHLNASSTLHPIYQLTRSAQAEWDEKVENQSRTLVEAVEEYRRRYKREPPRGFGKWWEWVW